MRALRQLGLCAALLAAAPAVAQAPAGNQNGAPISLLPQATLPLNGTEVIPLVQNAQTVQASLANALAILRTSGGTWSGSQIFTGSVTITGGPLTVSGGMTVTGAFTATGLVTNADLTNPSTSVNGQTCTLGSTCTITAVASAVAIGTTTTTGGTNGRILFDNSGVVGELAKTGSGSVVLTTSPTLTSPLITPQTWTDTQTCSAGQISVDSGFIYVCTATNTVERAALSAF